MMAVRGKVLIVEDDRAICSFMRRVLEANGYESIIVGTGREALSMLTSHCPDVVILDLGLPDMDGMDVLTQLRAWSLMPVVVVSARTDEREKVRALDAGADDYITKPFSFPVLVAKAQALMRRARGLRLGDSELGYANILMDTASGTVTVDGNPVNLRPKETKILELLLREQGRTVSRDLLIERVWGTDFDGDERMIDRHIASLRKALGTASQHIRAVYGKGYRLGGST